MQAYCVKCRAKREMKDAEVVIRKSGKPATQGVCPTCGTKMFRIGKNESTAAAEEQVWKVQHIKSRLDMLDQRFDNLDSMICAAAERVMNQPITLNIACPYCGKNLEIAVIGSYKPTL